MQIKFSFALLIGFLYSSVFAGGDYKCEVDDRIMFCIAKVERHLSRPIGYPYLISLNSKKDQKNARKLADLKPYFLDKRTLDCQTQEGCSRMLELLVKKGIKNLDCGAYQTNYMYWKMDDNKDYFDLKKSYFKACEIITLHNEEEWSWKNIAKYHSKTESHNATYRKHLLSAIEKTYKE